MYSTGRVENKKTKPSHRKPAVSTYVYCNNLTSDSTSPRFVTLDSARDWRVSQVDGPTKADDVQICSLECGPCPVRPDKDHEDPLDTAAKPLFFRLVSTVAFLI